MVSHQNIFRLQVSVIDAYIMTMFNSIQNLKIDRLTKLIVSNVPTAVADIPEEVAFRAILHYHIDAIIVVYHLEYRHDVWVCRCLAMKTKFAKPAVHLSAA